MVRTRTWLVLASLLVLTLLLANCAAPAAPADDAAPAAEATEAPAEEAAAAEEAAPEEAAADGDAVELRIAWYSDGNEGAVLRELLDGFEAENPDIKVIVDELPYATGILETLPIQLAAGEGPDMARVTDLGGLSQYYLDLTPYLSDAGLLGGELRTLLGLVAPARRREQYPRFHDPVDRDRPLHQQDPL